MAEKLKLALAVIAAIRTLAEAGKPVAQFAAYWWSKLSTINDDEPVPPEVFAELNASIEVDREKLHSDDH